MRLPRLLLPLAALLLSGPARAAVAVPSSVEELARDADAVVRGRVVSKTARFTPDHRRIFTWVEVEPSSVWAGTAKGRVTVLVPGGVVGDIGQRVDGMPAFAQGEDVVVFLSGAEAGAFRVTGLAQGKFSVKDGTATPDLSHMIFTEAPLRAGERRPGPMGVAELEQRVRSVR